MCFLFKPVFEGKTLEGCFAFSLTCTKLPENLRVYQMMTHMSRLQRGVGCVCVCSRYSIYVCLIH